MLGQRHLGKYTFFAFVLFLSGCGLTTDNSDSQKFIGDIQTKAEAGDVGSQALLGSLYLTGIGLRQNDALAMAWCHKAADQGNAVGENCLGLLNEYGRGVSQDDALALEWYRKSSEHKSPVGKKNYDALADYLRLGPKEFARANEQLRSELKSRRQAVEGDDKRPLTKPCPGCAPIDESGHGAVLCAAEIYVTIKAGLDMCYSNQHSLLRTDLSAGIDAIDDFIVINSQTVVTKSELERVDREKAAKFRSDGQCPGISFGSWPGLIVNMESLSHKARMKELADLLSVPRVPVMNPCL